ncbi:MAG: PadR family transcriptional regulator [Lachnospiraceae bacterium]|nr:PadR family transcriptional regulator [Lachnospiraceae bacterium]
MLIDKTLMSGSLGTMILRLLSEKDMYGYEMIEVLRSRSENVFELKAGTLYPLLHTLENKRFLISYEKEVSGKVRKYYQITKEGSGYLEQKKTEWEQYAKAVSKVLAMESTTNHRNAARLCGTVEG